VNDLLSAAGLLIPPDFDPPNIPIQPALLYDAGLRDYQWSMLLRAAALMRQGYRRILMVAPTGAGKTRIAAALMRSGARVGLTSEFIVHRRELLKQTSLAFTGLDLDHGFIARGWPFDPDRGVTLAGIQTLIKRLDGLLPPNLAVVDECHRIRAATYESVLKTYGPDMYVLGFTASPQRTDGKGMGEHFDIIVEGPPTREMIDRGFLCEYEYYAPYIPDLGKVDPDSEEAAKLIDKPKIVGDLVDHYVANGLGMQGIVFAASRTHSKHLADAFNDRGIRAMHVDGTMDDEREVFDAGFRAGDIQIGVNVGIFGEGYDVPNVGYVGIAAPTKSLVNHLQWCGRALRPAAGKPYAVIADHAGNAMRGLGLPCDPRQWSLEGTKSRKKSAVPDHTPVTQCKACFRVYPSAARVCPGCASETPAQPRVVREEAGTLTKVEREELRKAAEVRRKAEEKECLSFKQFLSLGQARGYGNPRGWAKIQCRLRRIPVPPS